MQTTLEQSTVAGDKPLVSVGIPTCNRPAGLQHTLECISGQTYSNLEILVSDNCSSTPETEAIVRAWQLRDARIVYYRQPHNIGLDANFKFLLEKARGAYFFWAADDDEWTADFVAEGLAAIGDAGSVMTGMRNAVRSQGLLRWKPPLGISPSQCCFENAVMFFTNLQPSLFYGIHRTDTLRVFLRERMYDYYDCFFILRQILTHEFRIAPRVCFHVGIDSEKPVYKPARPRGNAVYEYWPFLRDVLSATLTSGPLTKTQKLRLCFLLLYVGANEFAHFEKLMQPRKVRVLALVKRLMQKVAPLLRVPLPPAPPVMVLPQDSVDLCTMFIPHADLQSEEKVQNRIAHARRQLDEKVVVIQDLKGQLEWHRAAFLRRRTVGHLARFTQRFAPGTRPDDESPARPLASSTATASSLERAQTELGGLLSQLEHEEARLQRLVARIQFHVRRDARLAILRKMYSPAAWITFLATVPQVLRQLVVRVRIGRVLRMPRLLLRWTIDALLKHRHRDP